MAKKKPKVLLQKVVGENEFIVWVGPRWGGVVQKRSKGLGGPWRGVRETSTKTFPTRKEAVAWLVGK